MNAKNSEKMDLLDSFLSEKVNNTVFSKILENVTPALKVTMKSTIKTEAQKLLYALNHQENLSKVLFQLFSAEKSPELMKARFFIDLMKDEFKDDKEVQELLQQRPKNTFMYQGIKEGHIRQKVENRLSSLIDESPIVALQAFVEAVCMTGFDITFDDPAKKEKIEKELVSYFGNSDQPLEDAIKYALTLTSAHKGIENDQFNDKNSVESCINLLKGTREASADVNELLHLVHQEINQPNGSISLLETSKQNSKQKALLSDFLNNSCDVSSLSEIKAQSKGQENAKEILTILKHIDHSLNHTADLRRKNMKIADFLGRDSTLNMHFVNKVADTVLAEKVNKVADKLVIHKEAGLNIQEADLLSEDVKKMLSESIHSKQQRVIDKNTFTPHLRQKDSGEIVSESIQRDINNAIAMSDDLELVRSQCENEILRAFTLVENSEGEVKQIIDKWVNLRLIDLKSKPEYKLLQDSEFRNIMIDRFNEQVVTDIGLKDHYDNFRMYEDFNPLDEDTTSHKADLANKNSLNSIMENAIGYDRIVERLQSPEHSEELAQANYFEKMLAEYFLDKRKDYKASKDMLEVLNEQFNQDSFYEQTKRIGEDLDMRTNKATIQFQGKKGLDAFDAMASTTRDNVELFNEDRSKLMELGDSTNHAIQGPTHGIAESLSKYTSDHNKWPERLEKYDIRRKPKEWVEEKLYKVIQQMFSARERIEKNVPKETDLFYGSSGIEAIDRSMTRNELKAFDKHLALKLNKDEMIIRLLQELDQEHADLMQIKSYNLLRKQSKLDKEIQAKKHPNQQSHYNRKLQNLDAAYKLIAYRIAKRYRKNLDFIIPESAFEHYYERQLQQDLHKQARPIAVGDFDPKPTKSEIRDVYEADEMTAIRNREESRKMYERIDVKYILDKYNQNQQLNERATQSTIDFMNDYYRDDEFSTFEEDSTKNE